MGQDQISVGRRQLVLALALLAVLVLFTVVQGRPQAARPFDPVSTAPTGLRALWLWLEVMGYQVVRNDGTSFTIPPECTVIFVFPGQQAYTNEETATLQQWVMDGGTLVLIGLSPFDDALIERFQVEPGESLAGLIGDVKQQQLLLPDLPGPLRVNGDAPVLDLAQARLAIPVLATGEGQVTLALQPIATGIVWHTSLHHNFTNEQLRDPAQAMLVPALLRYAPAGSRILIDTFHLFGPDTTGAQQIQSLQDWLYQTWLGWALLFALATTFLFWVLQGRRLGPPLPTSEESRQREAAEYVMAMANLLRRSQQRTFVARHHKQRLKRGVGRALNISTALEDDAFLQLAIQADPTVAAAEPALPTLLHTLEDRQISETTLVQTISQVDRFLTRYGRNGQLSLEK